MDEKRIKFIVNEFEAGQRLDKSLSLLPEVSSRSYAQNLIEKKLVFVNGALQRNSYVLNVEDVIELIIPATQLTELIPLDKELNIIYEDADLIVVNKPSGLVVHPAHGHEQDTLVNALLSHTSELSMKNEQRPGIVHRIDKETSGLLVVAKNDRSHEILSSQFKEKTTRRTYFALVEGKMMKPAGAIESFLARHPADRKRYSSVRIPKAANPYEEIIFNSQNAPEGSKWAKTHYACLQKTNQYSYLKLTLETGRTHQIRVHMKELGHILVGDLLYGYKKSDYEKLGLKRFYLHAAELGFQHPTTKKDLNFTCPWPDDDIEFLKKQGIKL